MQVLHFFPSCKHETIQCLYIHTIIHSILDLIKCIEGRLFMNGTSKKKQEKLAFRVLFTILSLNSFLHWVPSLFSFIFYFFLFSPYSLLFLFLFSTYFFLFSLLIGSVFSLLLSNSLSIRRDLSILYSRIGIIVLFYCIYLVYNSLFITYMDSGIGIFGGLFFISFIT